MIMWRLQQKAIYLQYRLGVKYQNNYVKTQGKVNSNMLTQSTGKNINIITVCEN